MKIYLKSIKTALMIAGLLAATACGNVSRNVQRDGQSATQLVWPKMSDTTPMHKNGTFPNREDLMDLRAGLNKHQIANLVGFPHFSEGIWGVYEWNYVFNFHEPTGSDNVVTCQFKILFDDKKIARSFYWMPETCSKYMEVPVTSTNMATSKAPVQLVTLPSDMLFAFDRSSVEDITGDGVVMLDRLVDGLQSEQAKIVSIDIRGYADRLGDETHNQALSERRAQTIRRYLEQHGIAGKLMIAEGRGRSEPIKSCVDMPLADLIACLAPNRRVEIQVHTQAMN